MASYSVMLVYFSHPGARQSRALSLLCSEELDPLGCPAWLALLETLKVLSPTPLVPLRGGMGVSSPEADDVDALSDTFFKISEVAKQRIYQFISPRIQDRRSSYLLYCQGRGHPVGSRGCRGREWARNSLGLVPLVWQLIPTSNHLLRSHAEKWVAGAVGEV